MRTILSITFVVLAALFATPSLALTPTSFWSQRFGNTSIDEGKGIAVDKSGNVVVTGSFIGTVNFGGGNLVSANALDDIFVAKYNSSGVLQWSKRFGSTGSDEGSAVIVDNSGNVVVTGRFEGTVNFGGANLVSAGSDDIFVAKYDASGAHEWSERFGSTGSDYPSDVTADNSGNVAVTGSFQGTANFGGANLVSAGTIDIFLAKYNSNGVHQWSQRFGGTADDQAYSVAADSSGNLAVTGYFNNTVNFGGGNRASAGKADIFVAKYNSTGVHQWSQRFGSTDDDTGLGVALDGPGSTVAVTGYFQGTVNLGGGNLVSAGSSDIFVAKYNSSGVHQWSKRFGGTAGDTGDAIAVDNLGNVLVAGSYKFTMDLGGGNLVNAGPSPSNVFMAKYNSSGVHQWSQGYGAAGGPVPAVSIEGLAVDGSGNSVVTGSFEGTIDFGGGSALVSVNNVFPNGYEPDILIAQYGPTAAEPVITSILDVGNDQGRKVRIQLSSSGHDSRETGTPVIRYEAYRRNDALPIAMRGLEAGILSRSQLLDLGWVDAGSTQAHLANGYLMDAPTDADSTIKHGQHYSAFFIRAATASPRIFFDSPIDSGYSLDNLAPGIPTNLVLASSRLYWSGSSDHDFDYFTVYGSNSNFGNAFVIGYTVAPSLSVLGATYPFYFVTAADFSGNESLPASNGSNTGAGDGPTHYVLSVTNFPNPFNPTTSAHYTIPSRGAVTITVYDTSGSRVATLMENKEQDAGAYQIEWDGRSDRGTTVSSGVYFIRVEHNGAARTRKMIMLK